MRFTPSRIAGAWIIDIEPIHDPRGFFATTWLPEEFRRHGIDPALAQCNLAFNYKRGTLRGMHGLDDAAFDRRDSIELTADNRRMLYIPGGLAHGYLTLADDTEASYHASTPWAPQAEAGVRWNDPAFAITWPFEPTVISEKDQQWPLLP